jgi:uncharacterized membrane protein YphA (DoxX/SURF4 family)
MSTPLNPAPSSSMARTVAYWLTTVLVVFVFAYGGILDLQRPPQIVELIKRLGYPPYLCTILGTWKVLGAIALLFPWTPRLKEWAYAGILFDLTGAAASHFAVNDSARDIVTPLIIALVAVASWALRPASRRLAGSLV